MFLCEPCVGSRRGIRNVIKPMLFCFFWKWRAPRERPPNGSRRAKLEKNSRKIHVFRKCLGGSLASTLGGHYFCLRILRPQDGPVEGIVFVEKLMLFICFGRNRAPMQRGARLARRLLDTITPWVGSTKHQKQFKNNGLGHFWGTHLGHQSGSWKCKNRSYAARRSFFFFRNAPMQRGAHFLISDFPFGVLCWAQRGRQKHCKTNVVLIVFRMKGTLGAIATWIPKSKIVKIRSENQCFAWLPWELFGVNVGWSYLCLPILGPQGGLAAFVKFVIHVMVIWCFLHLSAKRCGAGCNRKCREVPKNNDKTTRKSMFWGDQYGANLACCIFFIIRSPCWSPRWHRWNYQKYCKRNGFWPVFVRGVRKHVKPDVIARAR